MYKFDTELALNSIKRSNEAIKTDSMILFAATRRVVKLMNIYNKVLVELDKNQSFKTQQNNLVKLQYSTEDYELRKRLVSWYEVLQQADGYMKRKLPSHAHTVIMENNYLKEELRDYCRSCIQSQRPEWQIIALKYGWRPTN